VWYALPTPADAEQARKGAQSGWPLHVAMSSLDSVTHPLATPADAEQARKGAQSGWPLHVAMLSLDSATHPLPTPTDVAQAPESAPWRLGWQHACICRLLCLAVHPWGLPYASAERNAAQYPGSDGLRFQVSCLSA
jgi:hypothetical protein